MPRVDGISQPHTGRKRKRSAFTSCWPKLVFLLANVAIFLSTGCLATFVFFSPTIGNGDGKKNGESSTNNNKDDHCMKGCDSVIESCKNNSLGVTQPANDGEQNGERDDEHPDPKKMYSNMSAHLSYKKPKDNEAASGTKVRLQFQISSLTNQYKGIDVREDKIIIQNRGDYFVYSNVQFLLDNYTSCSSLHEKVWNHVVKLTRNTEGPSNILIAYHTCDDKSERERVSSYTAGTFSLNVNDTVHVEVTGQGLIIDKSYCYFGLVLLEVGAYAGSRCKQTGD